MAGTELKLDDFVPYRMAVTSSAVSRMVARTYDARFGLSIPEWRLIALLKEDGPSAQQHLVARSGMDKVTVSRAAQALTKRRLIDRSPHENDGRSHLLALTEEGEALHAEVAPAAMRMETDLLSTLRPEDIAKLKELLRKIEASALRLGGGV